MVLGLIRWLKLLALGALLLAALFCWNGLSTSWQEPTSGRTDHPERVFRAPEGGEVELTLMAWNIAKCNFHAGGASFKTKDEVREQLDRIAAVVTQESVDLLFLSEVILEAAPCRVNQVAYLAEQAGFAHWCYGDNYSFGVPGARIRSGNALLSKLPMEALRVEQLPGGTPFWRPTGNRRILWAEVRLGNEPFHCASVRNNSFDLTNNAAQVAAILDGLPELPVVAAGDFNAASATEAFGLWRESGRFAGVFDGPATFPARRPDRRLDTVLLPLDWLDGYAATWTDEVLDVDLSDHEPVVVRAALRSAPR